MKNESEENIQKEKLTKEEVLKKEELSLGIKNKKKGKKQSKELYDKNDSEEDKKGKDEVKEE